MAPPAARGTSRPRLLEARGSEACCFRGPFELARPLSSSGHPSIRTWSALPRINHVGFVDHVVPGLAAFAFAHRDVHVHFGMIVPRHHLGAAARAFLQDRMIERASDPLAAELPAGRLDRFLIELN